MTINTWRKVRVVVEVPVRGEFTEKDLAWEVKATTEYDAKFLKRRHGLAHKAVFGRAVVKEYGRFQRAVNLHMRDNMGLTAATRDPDGTQD